MPNHNDTELPDHRRSVNQVQQIQVQQAQRIIYESLLEAVKAWPPEAVLDEFKRLFLCYFDDVTSTAIDEVYTLVFANDQVEFCHTLKRCCYILINNWHATRQVDAIKDLIAAFDQDVRLRDTASLTLRRLQDWVSAFKCSQDFADLRLFIDRYNRQSAEDGPWVDRFTSYRLVPQYTNLENPIEQREAARTLAQQLRNQYKVDLAMYVARSQSLNVAAQTMPDNPTALGEDVLRLIKTVVAKRGSYGYVSLSQIFLAQVQNVPFAEFKQSLQRYLIFSADQRDAEFVNTLQVRLAEKLDALYLDHSAKRLDDALILRTANRVIDFLTTEDHQEPSALFILLLSQGNPMTLVVTLLKLILISPNSRLYLEARIAELIHYYSNWPENECWWVIHFLEIFNVTFTIYAENVEYNLIKMEPTAGQKRSWQDEMANLDAYRVFSQLRLYHSARSASAKLQLESENATDATSSDRLSESVPANN